MYHFILTNLTKKLSIGIDRCLDLAKNRCISNNVHKLCFTFEGKFCGCEGPMFRINSNVWCDHGAQIDPKKNLAFKFEGIK